MNMAYNYGEVEHFVVAAVSGRENNVKGRRVSQNRH